MKVEYDSNNSGGGWWLNDRQWKDLEAAGWEVDWYAGKTRPFRDNPYENGRFLGALASSATREGLSLDDAVDEWERVTGGRSSDGGCDCCGPPHSFSAYDDKGNYVSHYSGYDYDDDDDEDDE